MGYYPFEIENYAAEFSSHDVEPGVRLALHHMDDIKIIKDQAVDRKLSYQLGGFIIIFTVFISFQSTNNFESVVTLLTGCAGLVFIAHGFFSTERKLIFDRQNRTVTVTPFIFGSHKIIPFDKIKALQAAASIGGGIGFSSYLGARAPGVRLTRRIGLSPLFSPRANWAFIVWYMDKNRPLPPSDALDAYRERDDARRAADGNPPPLYPASIDTDAFLAMSFNERSELRGDPKAWRENSE